MTPPGIVKQWKYDPYSGLILPTSHNLIVYGRGASDMKGGIVVILARASPHKALKSVVFPEPFGPKTRLLSSKTALTLLKTGSLNLPYETSRPSTFIIHIPQHSLIQKPIKIKTFRSLIIAKAKSPTSNKVSQQNTSSYILYQQFQASLSDD